MVVITMSFNQMFPLDVFIVGNFIITTKEKSESTLWHLRYGNFHKKGQPFPMGKSWRASTMLELMV